MGYIWKNREGGEGGREAGAGMESGFTLHFAGEGLGKGGAFFPAGDSEDAVQSLESPI